MPADPAIPWIHLRLEYAPFIFSMRAALRLDGRVLFEASEPRESLHTLRFPVGLQRDGDGGPVRLIERGEIRLHYHEWDLIYLLHEADPDRLPFSVTAPTHYPAAIFVELADSISWELPWEDLLQDLIKDLRLFYAGPPNLFQPEHFALVRLAARPWVRRAPFRLPLRAATVWGKADSWITDVDRHAKDAAQPFASELGLQIDALSVADYRHAPRFGKLDLIFCDASAAEMILQADSKTGEDISKRPHLLVVFDVPKQTGNMFGNWPGPALPSGMSLLWLPLRSADDAGAVVKVLLQAILDDQPLHGVLHRLVDSLANETLRLSAAPRLLSDPFCLHDLRFSEAIDAIVDDVTDLESRSFLGGNIEPFLKRVGADAPPMMTAILRELANRHQPLARVLGDAEQLQRNDYTGGNADERWNVNDLRARALLLADEPLGWMQEQMSALAKNPAVRAAFDRHQERRVDVSLRRIEPSWFRSPYVLPEQTLRKQTSYRLRVHIGRRSHTSLIEEDAPPIDPLLPEPEEGRGHVLHVAVYALDFRLAQDSPAMRRVVLPTLGGSAPVTFDVITPDAAGPGRLRIAVYYDLAPGAALERVEDYRNHLIQSFLLEARVTDEERRDHDKPAATRVRLEFSRSRRLADLEQLGPRIVSLAVNAGPAGQSHDVMFKQGGAVGAFHLTEKTIEDQLKAVRELLTQATLGPGGTPRFADGPGGAAQAGEFDRYLRDLAMRGRKLYNKLWTDAPAAFQPALTRLRDGSDEVIQIVRYDQNYLFPWAVLYDFPTPEEISGQAPVAVCRGFLRKEPDGTPISCQRCLAECHFKNNKEETFCVYGFWGLRHQVEQDLHIPFRNEEHIHRVQPRRKGGLCVAVGLQGGTAGNFIGELTQVAGADFVRPLMPADRLLDLLWADDQRPWLLVILTHYETQTLAGQPVGPRMLLPGGRWLQAEHLTTRAQSESPRKWIDPHPIIVLAACEAVAEDMQSLTGFLGAFADARAAAVVGTETVVFEGLAARFGKALVQAVLTNRSLGEAMLAFRRALIAELNPLGFVFTPYGDADLKVEAGAVAAPLSASAVAVPAGG
jgi:hypothetical protein